MLLRARAKHGLMQGVGAHLISPWVSCFLHWIGSNICAAKTKERDRVRGALSAFINYVERLVRGGGLGVVAP